MPLAVTREPVIDVATPTSQPTDAQPATAAPSAAEPTTDPDRDELLSLSNEEGALGDMTQFQCSATDGVWSAAGSLTNSTGQDLVY